MLSLKAGQAKWGFPRSEDIFGKTNIVKFKNKIKLKKKKETKKEKINK